MISEREPSTCCASRMQVSQSLSREAVAKWKASLPDSREVWRKLLVDIAASATRSSTSSEGPRARNREPTGGRQARFSVAKSISPCWLVNVSFLPLPLWGCCMPETR